jgi:hypothetical protein
MEEIIVQKYNSGVKIIQTQDSRGLDVYLVCGAKVNSCRYCDSFHIALAYAKEFDDEAQKDLEGQP